MLIKKQKLEGTYVVLEPLEECHIEPLKDAVLDGEAWKLWFANVPSTEEMAGYVSHAIAEMEHGNIAYAVRSKSTGNVVGTTRYYHVDHANRRAMVGYTWYADSAKRTPINTECKLLLLSNLFEQSQAIAVEFRTHFFNHASRNAIERLGAKLDGILRNHQIMKDGSYRDTVVYSIIASEWPAAKSNLLSKLAP
ncbi:GNAT family N-acetyltransferase (plasmid) [Pseudoalteromonas sp. T1lg65]|uniref:GNAT family N-acetyltransferase n=1 Tax=Pseudoalteromonas sp. T1lg65 TaxID=2077101 RepID=UPI003F7B1131